MTNWRTEDEPLPIPSQPTGLPPYRYTWRDWIRARWFYLKRWLRNRYRRQDTP